MTSFKERRHNKINCDCGGVYLLCNKSIHSRSKKHQNFLETGIVFVSKMPYRISSKRNCQLSVEDRQIKKAYYKIYNQKKYIRQNEEKKSLIMV